MGSVLRVVALFLCVYVGSAMAAPVRYDFQWGVVPVAGGGPGGSNYFGLGSFTIDSSRLTAGHITEADLSRFSFAIYYGNQFPPGDPREFISLTTRVPANFNFDTLTNTFAFGGAACGDQGQDWNSGYCGPAFWEGGGILGGVGLLSGNDSDWPSFNPNIGDVVGAAQVPIWGGGTQVDPSGIFTRNALVVTSRIIPEPTTLALLGLGLAGLAATRKRKQQ